MYRVSLAQFEGPLDLLLFFVRRDELDIYDIPISRITDEFLEYVRLLEVLDLDRVGEFIYMASLLIEIKARMMLPRTEVDEEGEPVDPRTELVNRLLEYMRFKDAASRLEILHDERGEHYTRSPGNVAEQLPGESENEPAFEVSLFQLVSALKRLLEEQGDETVHAIQRFEYTVNSQRSFMLSQLAEGAPLSFRALVLRQTKAFVIATFLAILELVREGVAVLMITADVDDFYLQPQASYGD